MDTVELLQQIGLNKYEAEAYFTLLVEGALTGYELGKRSQVPLSRSYEILERLTQKGLALVQPGEPPRYIAADPQRFLEQVRSSMATTLDALTASLSGLSHPDVASEFWVVRGRQHILSHARSLIAEARETVDVSLPPRDEPEITDTLASARARRVEARLIAPASNNSAEIILLLVDGRQALIGTLAPAQHCQAVTCTHPALIALLRAYFARQIAASTHAATSAFTSEQAVPVRTNERLTWLAWEERKQRHLWSLTHENRVA